MAYTIHINEGQRIALVELLEKHPEMCEDTKPLRYWLEMLEDLPNVEREYPGTLHGFCL